jgi:hypothetical protein
MENAEGVFELTSIKFCRFCSRLTDQILMACSYVLNTNGIIENINDDNVGEI